jgi:imidazolonepropionase-like amidohydrolase
VNYLAWIVFALSFGVGSVASAQTVLTGGEVHLGDGTVLEDGVVVIGADGKIAAVGENVAAPANATEVDVSGKVVTPGLIELDTQLGLVEIAAVAQSRDGDPGPLDEQGDKIRAAFRVVDAFNPMSEVIPHARVNGVTSALTLPQGGIVAGQGAFIDLAGKFGYATVVRPFAALKVALGGRRDGSRGAAMLRLREVLEDAKFWKENEQRYDRNQSRELGASRLDLAVLVRAMEGDIPVLFEVHRASDIKAVLTLARTYGLRPVILGGTEAWMVADQLARDDVPVVVNPLANIPWSFDRLGARSDIASALQKAGVKVVIASRSTHNARNLRYVAGNAVREGLDHEAALVAVTKNAADALGLGDQYGTLEAGKAGNVVVWSADPFEISTSAESVWIGGKKMSDTTRQRQLFERYRQIDRRGEPAALTEPADDDENSDQTAEGATDVESDH